MRGRNEWPWCSHRVTISLARIESLSTREVIWDAILACSRSKYCEYCSYVVKDAGQSANAARDCAVWASVWMRLLKFHCSQVESSSDQVKYANSSNHSSLGKSSNLVAVMLIRSVYLCSPDWTENEERESRRTMGACSLDWPMSWSQLRHQEHHAHAWCRRFDATECANGIECYLLSVRRRCRTGLIEDMISSSLLFLLMAAGFRLAQILFSRCNFLNKISREILRRILAAACVVEQFFSASIQHYFLATSE